MAETTLGGMADGSRLGRWRDVLAALVDLVLPEVCAGCSDPISGAALCEPCSARLRGRAVRVRPDPCPPSLPPTFAVTSYEGAARAALLAHKEHGRLALARPLGEALAIAVEAAIGVRALGGADVAGGRPGGPALAAANGGSLLLVAVPTTRAAIRKRGHDPTGRIAAVAADVLRRRGVPVCLAPVLRHRRRIADQAGLTAAERAANLHGALHVPTTRSAWLGVAPVIVLDDVVTTGATISEANRALLAAGAQVRGAAVVATTQRWHANIPAWSPTGPARGA